MANALSVTSTWAQDFDRSLILRPVFTDPDIMSAYNVDLTVHKKKTLNLATKLTHILQKGGTCTFAPSGQFTTAEKDITTCELKVELEQCYDTIYGTALNELLRKGTMKTNLEGTEIQDIIMSRTTQAIRNDIPDLAWFGDTDSTAWVYDCFNGYFELFENDANVNKVAIATTGALGDDEALTILRTMYADADDELDGLSEGEKVFYVTRSIYENLLATYEDAGLSGTELGMVQLQNGISQLRFRGIPVIKYGFWDRQITALGLSDPHRAVYTNPMNLIIGADIAMPGDDALIWYEKKDKKLYIQAEFDFGVQFLFDEWAVYAR